MSNYKLTRLLVTLLAYCLLVSCALTPADNDDSFTRLLTESGMTLTVNDGYQPFRPTANPVFNFQQGYRSKNKDLEVLYVLRPTKELDKGDKSNTDNKHLAENPKTLFQAVYLSISGGSHTPSRDYSPEKALEFFNADWASASVFKLPEDFGSDYKQVLFLGMHKAEKSDAYVAVLFNEFPEVKDEVKSAIKFLRYL